METTFPLPRLSTPDKVLFNQEISIELRGLYGKPILHIVDTRTIFQNAINIRTKRAEDVW